jgi:hypothetical protein
MSWAVVATIIYGVLIGLVTINVLYLRRHRRPVVAYDGPLVSILIPARNEGPNLRRLLPTLLAQRYPRFEVVVYDDDSEDDTAAVAGGTGDDRVRLVRGSGPPPGWIGKVHALFRATRVIRGEVLLFLDADTELRHPDALGHLMGTFLRLPAPRVMTGLPRLSGGGGILVGMIPFSLFTLFPLPLASVGRWPVLGILNGQCWLIDRATYFAHEPHRTHPDEILEDIRIGRYLKRCGAAPHLRDLQQDVAVWMYGDIREAWRGFRKNAYLIAGGHPVAVLVFGTGYVLTCIALPVMTPVALAGLYVTKGIADRFSGFPWWITMLTPIAVMMSFLLLVDSTLTHWRGRVQWKGRRV